MTRGLVADFTYNTDFAQVEDDEQQARRRTGNPGDIPLPFFSRRIGIDNETNRAVPIIGGGRLTGRAGPYSVGLVNIQTKDDRLSGQPSTNFAVARVRRDILRRSNIGVSIRRASITSHDCRTASSIQA